MSERSERTGWLSSARERAGLPQGGRSVSERSEHAGELAVPAIEQSGWLSTVAGHGATERSEVVA